MKRRGRFAIAVAAGTVLIAAAAAEVALRIGFARRMEAAGEGVGDCLRASPVPVLIYEGTPGRCGNNSRGFLDPERAVPKPRDLFRVLVIGDSVAAGAGLTDEQERFARVLERELRGAAPARRLEVAVLARSGYSTVQELYLLEHEAADYEPDLIIWSYCLNDPADPFFHDANGDLGPYFRRPALQLVELARHAWFSYRERRRGRGCPPEYHRFLHCAYAADIERNLGRAGAWSAERGVPVVLLVHALHPSEGTRAGYTDGARFASYAKYPFRDLHAWLASAAERAGLTALDELDAYGGARADEVSLSPRDPWHPSALGHQRVGRWLAVELARRRLVPRAGP